MDLADDERASVGRAETICALAGGLAHHLNNLLATALMSVDLLDAGARTPEERQVIAGLEESLRGGVALVRQMLWLARAGEGEPIAFQLRSLLADAQRMLRALLPAGCEVATDYPPELPLLFGDPVAAYRLLVHLGLAAAEAAGGEGSLLLATRAEAGGVVVEASAGRGELRAGPRLEALARQAGGALEVGQSGGLRVVLPAGPQSVSPSPTA